MKLLVSSQPRRGSTILVVLVLCCITLLILGSALQWSSTNTTLSQRNNEYFRTIAVAEGATEKLLSRITTDYRKNGEVTVFANTNSYITYVPTNTENAILGNYEFSDGQGNKGKMFVQYNGPTAYKVLDGPYKDLRGYATPFRIISNAKQLDSLFKIVGAVRQDFELSTIPIFQFAVFYNLDLEIAPGADMEIIGPVHSNEDVYVDPGASLTFKSDLTSAGNVYEKSKYGSTANDGTVTWGPTHKSGASSLNLPIGTNNTADAVREVVEQPDPGELASSDLGKERFYNKADLIIRIKASDKKIYVKSGLVNGFGTTFPQSSWDTALNASSGFLTTNVSFFNNRENKTVTPIQIDIAKLVAWNLSTNNTIKSLLTNENAGGNLRIIYVVDERTHGSSTESGVRLKNGDTLLPKGLTVATPNPLYVWGDFNTGTNAATKDWSKGTTNTAYTKPAALVADAITILSDKWKDSDSTKELDNRKPEDTTVNAAFLAGIVETTNSLYSGGVENFPRFLEDWGGTFTYNGSMVVMYPSKYATGKWGGTGDDIGIYNAPTRKWAFDRNFYSYDKLPPGTPMIRGVVRTKWSAVAANTVP